jgi:hypothetical protein
MFEAILYDIRVDSATSRSKLLHPDLLNTVLEISQIVFGLEQIRKRNPKANLKQDQAQPVNVKAGLGAPALCRSAYLAGIFGCPRILRMTVEISSRSGWQLLEAEFRE